MAQGGETRGGITPQNALAVLAYVAEAFPQARDIETRFLQQGMHPEHAPLLHEDPEQEAGGDRGPHRAFEFMPRGSFYRRLAENIKDNGESVNFLLVNNHGPQDQATTDKLNKIFKKIRERYEEICKLEGGGLEVARISTAKLPVSLHGIPHIAHYFTQELPLLMCPEFPHDKATFHRISLSQFAEQIYEHFHMLVEQLNAKWAQQENPIKPAGPFPFTEAFTQQIELQCQLNEEIKTELRTIEKILTNKINPTLLTYLYLQIVRKLQEKITIECA